MNHTFKVTVALVIFFFMAQFIGLLVINHYIDHKRTVEAKAIVFKPLPYGFERPEVKNQSTSFIYITLAVLIGTALVLLLIKFNKQFIWKLWFFATVWLTLSIAFAAFINSIVAAVLALVISVLKLYKPGLIVQNLSEIFIYGGLAAIFVPMINLFAAFMLLIVISAYDFVAVFKTKHMVKLAKFQSESKVFAGLLIPYGKGKISVKQKISQKFAIKKQKTSGMSDKNLARKSVAVLGGGDIGFTLIFAGVVMKGLMLHEAILTGFLKTLIVPFFVSLALLILLLKGEQNKFYPAMPVLSFGCLIGYLIVLVV